MIRKIDRNLTLLELMISIGVFTIIMGAALNLMATSQDLFSSQSSISLNTENARVSLEKIMGELAESSLLTVDTTFRPQGVFEWSNHFRDSTPGNKHCTSITDIYPTSPETHTTWKYAVMNDGTIDKTKHGKNWLDYTALTCPLDGSFLTSGCWLDGVKFFSPRDEANAITFDDDSGLVEFKAIIFYMPYRKANSKTFELRRYVVYLQDLFGKGNVIPDGVTLVKLWDFNNDGRLDDGGVANLASYNPKPSSTITDKFEVFDDTFHWKKIEGTKKSELTINRQTGLTTWIVEDVLGVTRTRTFTRSPLTIVFGLLDIDISTKETNPFDATNYVAGLDHNVVRVTLAFRRPTRDKPSKANSNEVVLTSEIRPRNKLK